MTDGVEILVKGVCPGGENFVVAKNYLLAREEGKRFLLVKLFNGMSETVTAVTLYVEQFDDAGDRIAADEIRVPVSVCPGKACAVEKKIFVTENCADCRVTVVKAECDGYEYTPDGEPPVYRFEEEPEVSAYKPQKRKMGKDNIKIARRSLKMPILITVTSLIVFIAAFAAVLSFIGTFKAKATEFIHDGVRYEFVGGDKSDDSDIIAVGANGSQSKIVIPKRIDNHKVKGIKEGAFANDKAITSLEIYAETEVSMNAFSGCANLKSANLENVTRIGMLAFSGCALTSVKLDKIDAIDALAFSGCGALRSFIITDSKEQPVFFSDNVLKNCTGLKTVDIARELSYIGEPNMFPACDYDAFRLKNFDYGDGDVGISVLFDTAAGGTVSVGALRIDEVDEIGAAFSKGISIRSLTVKALVSGRIGDSAFENTGISELNLPSRITSVGERAFYGCSLREFDASALEVMGKSAFASCASLTSVKLEDNETLAYISESAFEGCRALSGIYIPESVKGIGERAFYDCGSLYEVAFASGSEITVLPSRVFAGCGVLNKINIPATVTEISDRAFYGCAALESVLLPDALMSVGRMAFGNCALKNPVVPDGVVSIGMGAFVGCKTMTSYTAPFIGLTRGDSDFFSLFSERSGAGASIVPRTLASLTFTSVTSVGSRVFANCDTIKSITFPNGVAALGNETFSGCTSLERVTFGDAVPLSAVGSRAFENCAALTEIELPDSVETIGAAALAGCTSLEKITVPFLGVTRGSRDGTLAFLTQQVPENLHTVIVTDDIAVASYAYADCYNLREVIYDCDIQYIRDNAFYGCRNIKKFTLPSAVEYIGDNAFYGCYTLYEVHNNSDLDIVAGSETHGYIGRYALRVFGKAQPTESLPNIFVDGYEFVLSDGELYMVNYTPAERLVFPQSVTIEGVTGRYHILGFLFYGDTAIKSIDMNDGVKGVRENAFYACAYLAEAKLSDNIEYIGANAFAQCGSLASINFPKRLDYVAQSVFENCVALEKANILSASRIEENAFSGCTALKSVTVPEGCVSVGERAFLACESLYEAFLPSTCTAIGNGAFQGCVRLRDISIPVNCESIGEYAFAYCRALKYVYLGSKLKNIGIDAFVGCIKLIEVTNKTGRNIDEFYFTGLTENIEQVFTDDSRLPRVQVNDLDFFKIKDVWTLVDYIGESDETAVVDVKAFTYGTERVTGVSVRRYAFDGVYIGTFKSSIVTYVQSNAFINTDPTAVEMSGSSIYLESYAFRTGDRLASVKLVADNDITVCTDAFNGAGSCDVTIETRGNVYIAGGSLPKRMNTLTVTCGNFVAENSAIYGYDMIERLSVTATGTIELMSGALASVPRYVTFDANEVKAYDRMFAGTGVVGVTLKANNDDALYSNMFAQCYALESVEISGGIASLPDGIFSGCSSMRSAVLPSGLTRIDERAFADCGSLSAVNIPNGVTAVGASAFTNCGSLTSVTVPSKVNTLGAYAFAYCGALQTANVECGINIPECLFFGDGNLTTVKLAAGTKIIGYGAFGNCYKLSYVTLPNGLTTIGDSAFMSTGALSAVTLPGTLVEIGDNAFSYSGLVSVTLPNSVTTMGMGVFSCCSALTDAKLSTAIEAVPDSTFNYCYYLKRAEIPSGIERIGSNAFAECNALTDVTIPGTVKTINDGAFQNCTSLEKIELPRSLTSLGYSAFIGCVKLTDVKLPDTLSVVPDYAFANCYALTKIEFPRGVNAIESNAFSNCVNLADVSLPATLTRIGDGAFASCSALTYIVLPARLTSLGSGAFNGCTNLLGICNKSNVRVQAKSFYCADGAMRPLIVSSNENEAKVTPVTAASGNIYALAGGTWYLLRLADSAMRGDGILYLPENETVSGVTVKEYTVLYGAYTSGAGSMMLPSAATSIENGALPGVDTIFYKGTSAQYENVRPALGGYYQTVYYYKTCLHGDEVRSRWTFDSSGNVTRELTELKPWAVHTAATCTEKGEERRECAHCDYYEKRETAALGHDYENGVCKRCRQKDPDYKEPEPTVPIDPQPSPEQTTTVSKKERENA